MDKKILLLAILVVIFGAVLTQVMYGDLFNLKHRGDAPPPEAPAVVEVRFPPVVGVIEPSVLRVGETATLDASTSYDHPDAEPCKSPDVTDAECTTLFVWEQTDERGIPVQPQNSYGVTIVDGTDGTGSKASFVAPEIPEWEEEVTLYFTARGYAAGGGIGSALNSETYSVTIIPREEDAGQEGETPEGETPDGVIEVQEKETPDQG